MEKSVIIVAGGIGKRMESDIPKQFLNISGKPILLHTMECFIRYSTKIRIIIVLPEYYMDYWKSLVMEKAITLKHELTSGGEMRFHSVKNGLKLITEPGLVAVHDGVRPLVSSETLHRVFIKAENEGNAIPVIPITETMRKLSENSSKTVFRDDYRLIQTPQVFEAGLLKKAYEQEYRNEFTDDATVVESLGVTINMVEGNPENIKITRQSDLKYAENLLN